MASILPLATALIIAAVAAYLSSKEWRCDTHHVLNTTAGNSQPTDAVETRCAWAPREQRVSAWFKALFAK